MPYQNPEDVRVVPVDVECVGVDVFFFKERNRYSTTTKQYVHEEGVHDEAEAFP